jgi:DNA invertase Pin-like site-specific DNA recombinase
MVADSAARRGQVAAVTRHDRLGWSSLDLLANSKTLARAGVRSACTEQAFDIVPGGDAVGQLVLTVFAGVAQFERAIIRDRVESQRCAKARGEHIGRPSKDGPSPDAVSQLHKRGISCSKIATRLACTVGMARCRHGEDSS